MKKQPDNNYECPDCNDELDIDGSCINCDFPESDVYDLCDDDPGEECGRWDQSAPGGMWPVGMCRLAGTEQCDFECPYRDGGSEG